MSVGEHGNIVASGNCGDNAYYTLYSDGYMDITGTGDTWDRDASNAYFFRALKNTGNTIKHVVVHEGITSLGDCLFYLCGNITCVELPETLTRLGRWSLCYCSRLTELNLPKSLRRIEYSALGSSTSLTEITIPCNVEYFGQGALSQCSNLQTIIFEDGIKDISNSMSALPAVSKVYIPSSVTKFGYALSGLIGSGDIYINSQYSESFRSESQVKDNYNIHFVNIEIPNVEFCNTTKLPQMVVTEVIDKVD